jgi:hypothetical protein
MRSMEDVINFQERNGELSNFQVGNEVRSDDLIDCQEGRGEIPIFQVGKGEDMNSSRSSYQQGELMEEDQRSILIIGGIQIFLPTIPTEASTCVADAAGRTTSR